MLRALCLSLALLGAVAAQQPVPVTIGTWNIEFLGADPKYRRDTPPRDEEDYTKIGQFIRALGVAALGVQEISGEAPLQRVAKAAGPSWRAILGTSGQWTDGKTQQGVGFLYDSAKLTLLHCEELLDFPSERDGVNVFHRKPVTACFRHAATGADFRLVVVHLKAGRKDRDRQKRRAEAQTLREWVGGLQDAPGEDPDVAILGDFNCTYGDAPEGILEAAGALTYLEQAAASPTILWFDDPIDQVAVAAGFQELLGQTLTAHAVSAESERLAYRKSFSDHFACTTTLQLRGDDDPDATFTKGPQSQWLPVSARRDQPSTNPRWPLAVGAKVEVMLTTPEVGEKRWSGVLAAPLPKDRGWVVIEREGVMHAFPMERVAWLIEAR